MSAGIKKEHLRTVDLYPTILSLMGKPVPVGVDGVDLSL
jgi:arylsulfatase A-like enzyme